MRGCENRQTHRYPEPTHKAISRFVLAHRGNSPPGHPSPTCPHAEEEPLPPFSTSSTPPCDSCCCVFSLRLVSSCCTRAAYPALAPKKIRATNGLSFLLLATVYSLANSCSITCKRRAGILAQPIHELTTLSAEFLQLTSKNTQHLTRSNFPTVLRGLNRLPLTG